MAEGIRIVYDEPLHCTATHPQTKKRLESDAGKGFGGKGECYNPLDLVSVALGSCIMLVMGKVAQGDGLDIQGAEATVVSEMADMRIAKMKVTLRMPRSLPEADRAKIEKASEMCPVYQALKPTVAVQVGFIWPA
jgi:uncharacterized OsmC-like protein